MMLHYATIPSLYLRVCVQSVISGCTLYRAYRAIVRTSSSLAHINGLNDDEPRVRAALRTLMCVVRPT